MKRWMIGMLALGVVGPALAQDKPEDVVKKAIAAHGGLETLKKYPAATSAVKGKLSINNREIPITGALAFQMPGKVRMEMQVEAEGQKFTQLQVVNGDTVKQTENGKPTPLDDKVKKELKQALVIQEMLLVYPLLDAAKFTLTAEKDADLGGKPAAVLLVKSKEAGDVRLFFDRGTGLLVRMQRKGLSPAAKEVDEVTTFADFQKVSGLVLPMKSAVTHDGKPFLDLTVTEYKPLEKADAKLFDAAG